MSSVIRVAAARASSETQPARIVSSGKFELGTAVDLGNYALNAEYSCENEAIQCQ